MPWIALAAFAGILLVTAAAVPASTSRSARRTATVSALLTVAVACILLLTLAVGTSDAGAPVNLVPGRTIAGQLTGDAQAVGVVNIVGNVLLFVPIGWLVALLAPRSPVLAPMLVGTTLSVAIEVTQLFIGRIADIDDVLINTGGALVGAGLAALVLARRGSDVGVTGS